MELQVAGWGFVFALPVGIGVAMAVLQTLGTIDALPLAAGAGLVAIVAVFGLIYVGSSGAGSRPEAAE